MAKVRKKRREPRKFTRKMKTKLMVLFLVVFAGLCILIGRLMYIQYTSGEKYERKVLSLQSYDSITIPFQRGNIVDTNGTVLATSVAVYNVILDSYIFTIFFFYIRRNEFKATVPTTRKDCLFTTFHTHAASDCQIVVKNFI